MPKAGDPAAARFAPPRWAIALLFATAAWLMAPGLARADSIFGLSYFGSPTRLQDGRIEGRGGVGLAYRDSLNAAIKTPTQLVNVSATTFSITSNLQSNDAQDQYGQVGRTKLVVPTLKLALPLGRRAGLGVGFESMRATQWKVVRPYDADHPDIVETIEREGTQFLIPMELGLQLTRRLVVGGGMLLERGTIRLRYMQDLGSGLVDPSEVKEDTHSAITFRVAAALYDLGPFSFAGVFIPDHEADVKVHQQGVALDAREDRTRTETRPGSWGMGTHVALGGGWNLGADAEQELWSRYEGRAFEDVDGNPSSLNDETTLRLGLEREARSGATGDRTAWRAGGYWRKWNYTLGGNDLTEWGVTLGTGIPFRSKTARADLVVGYGRIGSLQKNGAQEDVFRIVFSVSASERWY
jgi:hypothetical protein